MPSDEFATVVAIMFALSSGNDGQFSFNPLASLRLYSSISCLLSSALILILAIPSKSFRAGPSSWLMNRHRNLSGSSMGRSSTSFLNHCEIVFRWSRGHSSKPSRMMYAFLQFPKARLKSSFTRVGEVSTASPPRHDFSYSVGNNPWSCLRNWASRLLPSATKLSRSELWCLK